MAFQCGWWAACWAYTCAGRMAEWGDTHRERGNCIGGAASWCGSTCFITQNLHSKPSSLKISEEANFSLSLLMTKRAKNQEPRTKSQEPRTKSRIAPLVYSSLVFHHSSLITYHLLLITCLSLIHLLGILLFRAVFGQSILLFQIKALPLQPEKCRAMVGVFKRNSFKKCSFSEREKITW